MASKNEKEISGLSHTDHARIPRSLSRTTGRGSSPPLQRYPRATANGKNSFSSSSAPRPPPTPTPKGKNSSSSSPRPPLTTTPKVKKTPTHTVNTYVGPGCSITPSYYTPPPDGVYHLYPLGSSTSYVAPPPLPVATSYPPPPPHGVLYHPPPYPPQGYQGYPPQGYQSQGYPLPYHGCPLRNCKLIGLLKSGVDLAHLVIGGLLLGDPASYDGVFGD